MKTWQVLPLALTTILASPLPAASTESRQDLMRPPDALLLVQSELQHLPAARHAITLEVDNRKPAVLLGEIAKKSGLVIKVRGTFSTEASVSASFKDTETGKVLAWLAEQVPMQFRAEPPNTLWVITEPKAAEIR